jgi:hypothetical protein
MRWLNSRPPCPMPDLRPLSRRRGFGEYPLRAKSSPQEGPCGGDSEMKKGGSSGATFRADDQHCILIHSLRGKANKDEK